MKLGYDRTEIEFTTGSGRLKGVLLPNAVEVSLTGEAEVCRALDAPIGAKRIEELVKPGQKVCIVTSDITRPMPSYIALPPLIERLNGAGIPDKDILIVFGLGSHRAHTEEEKLRLVGDAVYDRIECADSDPDDCKYIGTTSRGTRVDIYSRVADSSGGAKAIMPGVSTREAIRANHSMMVMDEARAGNLQSPVRLDIEEAGALLGIDYILNVVLDEHKKIIYAVAGDAVKAHRAGTEFLDKLYCVDIDGEADVVVVSAGGYPKDQNMYQAQKALDNAVHAVKKGGVIIWLASCKEGLGSKVFEEWMTGKTPDEMIRDIKENFVLGGHKAAAIALVLKKADVYLVSDLDAEFVKSVNLIPQPSLEAAFEAATRKCGENSSVYVMPYGGSTLPVVKK